MGIYSQKPVAVVKEAEQEVLKNENVVSEAAILMEDRCAVLEGYEEAVTEAIIFGTYIEEAAKFSFLPRFKEKEEHKQLAAAISEAETLLNSEGHDPKTGIHKFGKLAVRILDIYMNIEAVVTLPTCFLIVGIPLHLIMRAIDYAIQIGKEAVAESYADKCIRKLAECKAKANDPKKEAQIEKQIEKMKKAKANLKKEK